VFKAVDEEGFVKVPGDIGKQPATATPAFVSLPEVFWIRTHSPVTRTNLLKESRPWFASLDATQVPKVESPERETNAVGKG
jgi:hypothetical protein